MSKKRQICDSVKVLDVVSYITYHIDDFIEMINDYRNKIEEKYDIIDSIRISLEMTTYGDTAPILTLYFYRLETDSEYEQRLKEEENKKRKASKKKEEEAEKEYELFLKLKKKYERSE